MSNDIQAGDKVVCIDNSPCRTPGCGLSSKCVLGRVYQVERIDISPLGSWGIVLQGIDSWPHKAENPKRFRKIDKADDTFVEQVKACRPITVKS